MVRGLRGGQEGTGLRLVRAAEEVVLGDVVGALAEDVDAVHDEGERLAVGVVLAADRDGAEPDLQGAGVLELVLVAEEDDDFVERLLPVSRGVPFLGVAEQGPDFDRTVLEGGPDHVDDGVAGILDDDFHHRPGVGGEAFGGNPHAEADGSVGFMLLRHRDVLDPDGAEPFDPDVAPDAGVRQLRTPVPAEHRAALAQMDVALDGIPHLEEPMRAPGVFFADERET